MVIGVVEVTFAVVVVIFADVVTGMVVVAFAVVVNFAEVVT